VIPARKLAQEEASREELIADALGRGWYHTIDLGDGRATSGAVDLRGPAAKILPRDLSGRRALDVGTFDGFWAFELERRGADVIAADLERLDQVEWPPPNRERLAARAGDERPGERFGLAARILGSHVRRVESSIYDLDPARLGGHVDDALVGALLLHLRDPVRGLERVRDVLTPGGRLIVIEPFRMALSILRRRMPAAHLEATSTDFNWWVPNLACLRAWLVLAGFEQIERRAVFRLKGVKPIRQWCAALVARSPQAPVPGPASG
jgi:SAM-dependent methyltransferase